MSTMSPSPELPPRCVLPAIALALSLVTTAIVPAAGRAEHKSSADPGSASAARQVYERLIAPCCWTQTLDIHDSDVATELRVEIVHRLRQGEPPAAIESDLAGRYGERIRAVPAGRDPRQTMALVVFAVLVLGLLMLVRAGRGWLHGTPEVGSEKAPPQAQPTDAEDRAYEALLDRELERDRSIS